MCSIGCGIDVGVAGAHIAGVRGRADHPVNQGRLGPKGLNQYYANRHPSRAVRPLIRNQAGNLVLAYSDTFNLLILGVTLWGAHMALTQGIFSRMIADSAPEELRATSFGAFWFVTGIAGLLASLGAGMLWDRDGSSATFIASAGLAALAAAMLLLLPEERRA